MNNLTMSQLAKLLNTTKYTIRHYEEKGLLKPASIEENGYKVYRETEIYRLAHILLLRKLHFSVEEIKKSLSDEQEYQKSFEKLLVHLESEIQALSVAKKKVQQILENNTQPIETIFFEAKADRYFNYVPQEFITEDYSLDYKKLASHQASGLTMDYDYYYLLTNDGKLDRFMYQTDEQSCDYRLKEGDYLVKRILISKEQELLKEIERVKNDALFQMNLAKFPFLIVHEEVHQSTFYNDSMVYSLEVMV